MSEDRAARFKELLDQAAIEHRCKPSDMAAQLSATRRLCIESYQEKLIAGRDVDVSVLREMLQEETRCLPPPEPLKVTIEVVGEGGRPISELPREPDPTPPTGGSPPNGGGGGPAPADSAPVAASGDNIVPFNKPEPAPAAAAPWRSPTAGGSINDAVLPDGSRPPIVRRASGFYPGGYDTVAGPFAAGVAPDVGAPHQLPDAAYDANRYPKYKGLAGGTVTVGKKYHDPRGGSVCW
jgi:hypothetical protein